MATNYNPYVVSEFTVTMVTASDTLNHRMTTKSYTVSDITVTMVTASDTVNHRVTTNPYTVSDLL